MIAAYSSCGLPKVMYAESFVGRVQVAPDKTKSFGCFATYLINVLVPLQVSRNVSTYCGQSFNGHVINSVKASLGYTDRGKCHGFWFGDVYPHLGGPFFAPLCYFVKVGQQEISIIGITNFSVSNTVIS